MEDGGWRGGGGARMHLDRTCFWARQDLIVGDSQHNRTRRSYIPASAVPSFLNKRCMLERADAALLAAHGEAATSRKPHQI